MQQYAKALKIMPNNSWVHADMAFAQRRNGQWDESANSLRRAVLLNPRESFMHFQLGESLLLCRKYAEADVCIDNALGLVPNYGDVYLLKSWLHLLRDGDVLQAHHVLNDALVYCDRFPLLTHQEIRLNCMAGEFESALGKLATADRVHVRPELKEVEFLCLRGDIFRYAGNRDQSTEAYSQALVSADRTRREREKDATVSCYMARALAGIGESEKAREQARWAIDLRPMSSDAVEGANVLREVAEVHVMTGDIDLAIDELLTLLAVPSKLSAALLAVDPAFKPLWDHSRFKALLHRYRNVRGAQGETAY